MAESQDRNSSAGEVDGSVDGSGGGEAAGRAGTPAAAGQGAGAGGTDVERYRRHFEAHYAGEGHSFDDYDPAYRYGHELARNDAYQGKDWTAVAPHARQAWEARQPGQASTWDRFKDAIRHGWETIYGDF
jgi:hypothetical protein